LLLHEEKVEPNEKKRQQLEEALPGQQTIALIPSGEGEDDSVDVEVGEEEKRGDENYEYLEVELKGKVILLRLKTHCQDGQSIEQADFEGISTVLSASIYLLGNFIILGTHDKPKYKA
jgi:hypothetical protein